MPHPTSYVPSRPVLRLRAFVAVALLGMMVLACDEESDPESDVLDGVPLYHEQSDGSRETLDDPSALAEVLEIDLDMPEALPEGLTIEEGIVRPPGGLLELHVAGADGAEARLRINRDTASSTGGDPVLDLGGVQVFQGEAEGETIYHWASCNQNYAFQTADEWTDPVAEEVIGSFVNSCEQPFSPPGA